VSEPQLPRVLVWSDIILDLQDLLTDDDPPVYIVGGAVRDAFLRRPIKDVDMATPASGIKLARRIANALRGDFYPLDQVRDVGRALVDTSDGKVIFDVAKFRGDSLEKDLRDRDFTINAMAVDLRGDLNDIIDPTGGEVDLKAKILRRCSTSSLADDPIRALRAVRQAVKLNLRIEPKTLRDIRGVAPRLRETSPERIRDEIFNLLNVPKPIAAIRATDALGLLEVVLPQVKVDTTYTSTDTWTFRQKMIEHLGEMFEMISPKDANQSTAKFTLDTMAMSLGRFRLNLEAHIAHVWANDRSNRVLILLSALIYHADAKRTETCADDLRLSNSEKDRLVAIQQHQDRFIGMDQLAPREIYRFWRDTGAAGIDIILLSLAAYLAQVGVDIRQDDWLVFVERAAILFSAYFDQRAQLVEPPAVIDGHQLMQILKLKPSPIIGELLELIRESQVTGEVRSIADALDLARRRLSENGFGGH
jgi:tRNA nucleotidyltransferase/poly(A) polymerase